MTKMNRKAQPETAPCDFAEYLGQHLGMSCDSARNLLSEWISTYQPKTRRPIMTFAVRPARCRGPLESELDANLVGGAQLAHPRS